MQKSCKNIDTVDNIDKVHQIIIFQIYIYNAFIFICMIWVILKLYF